MLEFDYFALIWPLYRASLRRVGCEIVFMPLLATDINHGSAFSNDNRPSEPPYGPRYRFFRRAEYDRARGGRGVGRKNSIGIAKQPIGTHDVTRRGQDLR